jgi:hypothetical protein
MTATHRQREALDAVNGWLGWGDPMRGLWFIGIEEGQTFTAETVAAMKGHRFQPVSDVTHRDWPIAVRTAAIVCTLSGVQGRVARREYRRARMGHPGSGVFNGNLRPLGSPSLDKWPDEYQQLFGLTVRDYLCRQSQLRAIRFRLFREARARWRPQAVICFGKSGWNDFRELFGCGVAPARRGARFGVEVHPSRRLILTPHFSRGSLMPNRTVAHVAGVLRDWGVTIPCE